MPNHTANLLTIQDCSKETYEKIKETLKGETGLIDFDKIVPKPDLLNNTMVGGCHFVFLTVKNAAGVYEKFDEYQPGVFVNDVMNPSKTTEEFWGCSIHRGQASVVHILPDGNGGVIREVFDDIPESYPESYKLYTVKYYTTWYSDGDTERPFTAEEEASLKDLGYESWYGWSVANWGTKWNAYSIREWDDEEQSIYFETAWSPPQPVIEVLSQKFPEVSFEISYADEGGCFLRTSLYKEGCLEWEEELNWNSSSGKALRAKLGRYYDEDDENYEK